MPDASYFRSSEQAALAGPRTFYTGGGRTLTAPKISLKGRKGGSIAAAIVVTILLGIGAIFLTASNSLLAPALSTLFTEKTDTQYTSSNIRTRKIIQYMLKDDYPVNQSWLGSSKYTHFPSSFKKRLANHGIEVVGTGSNKILRYQPDSNIDNYIDITADQFDTVFRDNLDFRDAYTASTRGRVANFFDAAANRIYQKLGISRNIFSDYHQTGDAEVDAEAYRDTLNEKFEGDTTNLGGFHQETDENGDTRYDEDGNPIVAPDSDTEADPATSGSASGAEAQTQASNFLNRVVGGVSQVANWGCTILTVGNMISVAIAANEIYQSINYFMGLMENVSKMKAGEGENSAINEVLNTLSTPATSTVIDYQSASTTTTADGYNTITLEETTTTQSPLEAAGMQLILADAPAKASDTANYSLERVTNTLLGTVATTGASITACAATGAATTIATIAVQIASGGIASVIGGFLVDAIKGTALSLAIGALLSFLVPTIAQSLFTNIFENTTGVAVGELFTRGASASNTRLGRSASGQSLSSGEAAVAYHQTTSSVLAEDAELDRHTKSPFDTSSKNTFLGSILYNLLPAATSSEATGIANLIRTTSSSLSSLVGGVSAKGDGSTYMTTYGDCPNLEAIGAKGDLYCNPITTTDVSTLNIEPDDPTYVERIAQNLDCDSDGTCEIRDNSDLAHYVSYCAERDSPFGIADANIMGEFGLTSDAGSAGTVIDSLPLIGDALSVVDSGLVITNMGWITGSNCVNSEQNAKWDKDYKYYQRYIEDQRILTQLGAYEDETDPVTAYIEKREAELPYLTDNTPAGYLARISGITKDDAETVLALAEYYTFIAEYDAGARLAMTGDTTTITSGTTVATQISTEHYRYTDNAPVHSPETPIVSAHILYADLRGRTTIA